MEIKACQKSPTFGTKFERIDFAEVKKLLGDKEEQTILAARRQLMRMFDDTVEISMRAKNNFLSNDNSLKIIVRKTLGDIGDMTYDMECSFKLKNNSLFKKGITTQNIIKGVKNIFKKRKVKQQIKIFDRLKAKEKN
ncbi:MAG: hypothetical protein WCY19_04535 [Candidatus Gastranaerophilaceae bacterium]